MYLGSHFGLGEKDGHEEHKADDANGVNCVEQYNVNKSITLCEGEVLIGHHHSEVDD
jgi:hypothetical protein